MKSRFQASCVRHLPAVIAIACCPLLISQVGCSSNEPKVITPSAEGEQEMEDYEAAMAEQDAGYGDDYGK